MRNKAGVSMRNQAGESGAIRGVRQTSGGPLADQGFRAGVISYSRVVAFLALLVIVVLGTATTGLAQTENQTQAPQTSTSQPATLPDALTPHAPAQQADKGPG